MAINVFKPLGITPLELIRQYKKKNNIKEKMSFAGRLDPMAYGQMVLLKGEDCKLQDTFCGKDKIYEFKIILGLQTDSLDILGIPKFLPTDFNYKKVFKGKFKQKYPRYSSKVISLEDKSKPLWWWEKQGKLTDSMIPEKEVEIYTIENKDTFYHTSISLKEIIFNRISRLSEVNREKFRYSEIKNSWDDLLKEDKIFKVIQYRAKVSSGTYIRGICEMMGGVALDINRTNIIF